MNLTLREVFDRYGPALALAAVLVLLVVLLPGNDERGSRPLVAAPPVPSTTGDVAAGAEPGDGPATEAAPATEGIPQPPGGGASRPGGSRAATTPRSVPATRPAPPKAQAAPLAHCRSDGRTDGFSVYMPPCVPVFRGDNGGSTSTGVTRDAIVVVRFMSALNPAYQAVLTSIGADDGRAKNDEMDETLVRYLNTHFETYGRQVVMKTYNATGADEDEAAMRRDAITIAEQIKPFAVFHIPPTGVPGLAFVEELAARGIVCVCTFSQPRSFYKRTAPYVWTTQPVLEEYYQTLAEYVGKRLAGKPAVFAGELPPGMKVTPRKFGLIYVNGVGQTVDPGYEEGKRFYEQELARYGVTLARAVSYTFDLSRQQEQATNIMAKMKDAGVSNLLCICDPFYPIFLTNEATRQAYFPEWLFSGAFGPIDTTFFGRTYNQAQWAHAFGVGTQPVGPADPLGQPGHRAYRHMRPGAAPGSEGKAVSYRMTYLQMLFTGIHMAGPNLTPHTFARGMYSFPRTGGQPKFPLTYFTPDSPAQVKDFTEVFWDPSGRGPDESGHHGVGTLMRAEGGRRYQPGQWERRDPKIFTRDGAVFTSAQPPDSMPHDADGHRHPPSQRCRSCG